MLNEESMDHLKSVVICAAYIMKEETYQLEYDHLQVVPKQAEQLKSREMVKDEGWRLNDEGWIFKLFVGFALGWTDWLINERTFVSVDYMRL